MAFHILASTRFFDAEAERFLVDHGCVVRRTGLPAEVQDDAI
ncbi:MAG: hypothetical protein JWR73_19, partial [Tardiphaga sp.]|nr:hypothetical protein [Tardiphaga sp.]